MSPKKQHFLKEVLQKEKFDREDITEGMLI